MQPIDHSLNAEDIAGYLKVTTRSIHRRALKEAWPFIDIKGSKRAYPFATLSDGVKIGIMLHVLWYWNQAPILCLQTAKEAAQAALLNHAFAHVATKSHGKIKALDDFCARYNQRTLKLDPNLYTHFKTLSRVTLLRWDKHPPKPKYIAHKTPFEIALYKHAQELFRQTTKLAPPHLRKHLVALLG